MLIVFILIEYLWIVKNAKKKNARENRSKEKDKARYKRNPKKKTTSNIPMNEKKDAKTQIIQDGADTVQDE